MKLLRILVLSLCLRLAGGGLAAAQTPAAATQPPAPSAGSPAAKIGVFVYPKKEQTPQEQANDESACYASAQQQTGIDPTAPPAPQEADKKKGGALKGAGGGAAGGAAIGAIAGDAGRGAAIGATAGAVRGRRQQKKANKQAEQQAQQQNQPQEKSN